MEILTHRKASFNFRMLHCTVSERNIKFLCDYEVLKEQSCKIHHYVGSDLVLFFEFI